MPYTPFTFGDQIAAARTLAGLTQSQLASAANLHRNAVSFWETKRCIKYSPALASIEKALATNGVIVERTPVFTIRLGTVQDSQFADTKEMTRR